MEIVLAGIVGPGSALVVIGAVIIWDRCREPYRNLHRPFAVVDRRTKRDAERRINRLLARGEDRDLRHAHYGMVAITTWLNHQRSTYAEKPQRRKALDDELARWRSMSTEFSPSAQI